MNERDRQLAQKLAAGDEQAFEAFFEEYFPRLYRFALVRLGGRDDAAEEVVQATLCSAAAKIATYRAEAPLFTWLCTFCRHEISALLRRSERESARVTFIEDHPRVRVALETLAADLEQPATELAQSQARRLVQVVLDHLPGRYASALEWKYIEDLSVRDIAERFGVSTKAAESLLTRAREAFRAGVEAIARGEESA